MGASESKLAFKQSVFLLAGQDEIPPSDPLWAQVGDLEETTVRLHPADSHPRPSSTLYPSRPRMFSRCGHRMIYGTSP